MGEVRVAPRKGGAIDVPAGALLTITDVQGKQCGDFISFAKDDESEFLSVAIFRGQLRRTTLQIGDKLFSNLRRPIWEIVHDDVGVHDILLPACDRMIYKLLGAEGHPNCRENLAEATGLAYARIPDPLNVFMHTSVEVDGTIVHHEPPSSAGAQFKMRSLIDQLAAISSCPNDLRVPYFSMGELIMRVDAE